MKDRSKDSKVDGMNNFIEEVQGKAVMIKPVNLTNLNFKVKDKKPKVENNYVGKGENNPEKVKVVQRNFDKNKVANL